jgi:hypothetical protein
MPAAYQEIPYLGDGIQSQHLHNQRAMNAARPKTNTHSPVITQMPASSWDATSVALQLRVELQRAFQLLLAAYRYAHDAQVDAWQLAVELDELRQHGLALLDLRWLVARGFAEHRREMTVPGDANRTFRVLSSTEFPGSTAVALTRQGATALSWLLSDEGIASPKYEAGPTVGPSPTDTPASMPVWDGARRELRFENQVVKRFRVPAANQEIILQAFQEDGWPHCIDDPLPPSKDSDAKGRLLATIKSLNRNQLAALLLFHGNGNGFQIYWEPAHKRQS